MGVVDSIEEERVRVEWLLFVTFIVPLRSQLGGRKYFTATHISPCKDQSSNYWIAIRSPLSSKKCQVLRFSLRPWSNLMIPQNGCSLSHFTFIFLLCSQLWWPERLYFDSHFPHQGPKFGSLNGYLICKSSS